MRELARRVHYSHSYLWDLETGHKQPTRDVASALDTALSADGALVELITDHEPDEDDQSPLTVALGLLEAHRHDLEAMARSAWSASSGLDARRVAGRWAHVATWLYESFVRSRPPLIRLGASRYSRRMRQESGESPFRMEVLRQGRTPRTECRSVGKQPAPADIAERLMIGPGEPVIRRENLYYADDEPIQIGITYIPVSIAGPSSMVSARALGHGSLYSRLEDLGYPVVRIRECVLARLPKPDEATSLKMSPGVPVLEVLHTSFDGDGRPFEVTRFAMRADLTVINYEMPVED